MNIVRIFLVFVVVGAACTSCGANRGDVVADGAGPGDTGSDLPDFLLYEAGPDPGGPIYGLHVGAQDVYWVQKNQGIYRGSRDGRGPAVKWGMIKGPYADTMTSDDQRLYWIEYSKLYYKDKGTGAEGKVVLLWDHTGGALAIDDRYVYTVMPGCPAILRIDKRTLAIEEMDIGGVAIDPRGGRTTLRLQDGGFYCAAWGNVFWIPGWEQPAKKLVDSANRLWGMALAARSLYWINNPGNQHMPYMSRLELDSGVVTNFPDEPAFSASNLVATPDGAWLFHTSQRVLHAFSTAANVGMIALPPDFTGRRAACYGSHIETDGEALYYTATRGIEGVGRVFGVHKVPFSYLVARLQKP